MNKTGPQLEHIIKSAKVLISFFIRFTFQALNRYLAFFFPSFHHYNADIADSAWALSELHLWAREIIFTSSYRLINHLLCNRLYWLFFWACASYYRAFRIKFLNCKIKIIDWTHGWYFIDEKKSYFRKFEYTFESKLVQFRFFHFEHWVHEIL